MLLICRLCKQITSIAHHKINIESKYKRKGIADNDCELQGKQKVSHDLIFNQNLYTLSLSFSTVNNI